MKIKAFKAYRFDEAVVGDAGKCIAPPYDVINGDQQDRLYEKSEYNIVRIIKGKTFPSDSESNNQYTRAADCLNSWIEKGILKQDGREAIYAYVQDFELAGNSFQRFSFIALAKLEEFGKIVRPHEQTLAKPIADRLNLKRATRAELGLVFMLYKDSQAIADKIIEKTAAEDPLIDFVDEQNVRHRLLAVTGKDDIDAISKMMKDKSCIIADGHHRYTTGLTYAKETLDQSAKYQMLAFSNTEHEGLIVLATHRVVSNLGNFGFQKLLEDLKNNFEIAEFGFGTSQDKSDSQKKMLAQMKAEYDSDKNAFGIYGGNNAFYVATLKNKKAMDEIAAEKSPVWRSLDVSVLHKMILEQSLGIDEKKLVNQSNVEYIKDAENVIDLAIADIDTGKKQVAFFMNPPKIEQIEMTTDHGERMPQKSTYFYPKIFTGLTINKL